MKINSKLYIIVVILLPFISSCALINKSEKQELKKYESRLLDLSKKIKHKDQEIHFLKAKNLVLLKQQSHSKKTPTVKKAPKLIIPEELEFEIPQNSDKMLAFITDEFTKANNKKSLTATDLYIQQYPDSKLLDQVHYYRALNLKSLKQYAFALKSFSVVENKYLLSPFRADSLLQKAEIYQIMNLNAYRQRTLYKLIRQYPKSREARLAQSELKVN